MSANFMVFAIVVVVLAVVLLRKKGYLQLKLPYEVEPADSFLDMLQIESNKVILHEDFFEQSSDPYILPRLSEIFFFLWAHSADGLSWRAEASNIRKAQLKKWSIVHLLGEAFHSCKAQAYKPSVMTDEIKKELIRSIVEQKDGMLDLYDLLEKEQIPIDYRLVLAIGFSLYMGDSATCSRLLKSFDYSENCSCGKNHCGEVAT